jgi:hypothetical protein
MFVPQGQQSFRNSKADVKIFYGSGATTVNTAQSWTKPVGASHIYMLLIGGGGAGDGSTSSGGSGGTTAWYGAAQNVPDALVVTPAGAGKAATNGSSSSIFYRSGNNLFSLITANGGSLLGGPAVAPTAFSSIGFYQSVAGQDGLAAGSGIPEPQSTTTFLSGGGIGNGVTGNYGYSLPSGACSGFFMLQPIIVGLGGTASTTVNTVAGVGCGGAISNVGNTGAPGGQGFILIASW